MPERTLPRPQPDWAVFLDFDGSIVELADSPELVHVDSALRRLLNDLQTALEGALAIVSGRPLSQIDHYLSPPLHAAAGLHGLERRAVDGTVTRLASRDARLDDIKQKLVSFAQDRRGVFVEDKDYILALHFRQAPDRRAECQRAVAVTVGAALDGIEVLEGKMVFEIRPSGIDKGDTIAKFLNEPPFAGRRPVFCGDDATDEHGFAVVNACGGVSVHVGEGVGTAAGWRVDSVAELRRWLATIPRALGDTREHDG